MPHPERHCARGNGSTPKREHSHLLGGTTCPIHSPKRGHRSIRLILAGYLRHSNNGARLRFDSRHRGRHAAESAGGTRLSMGRVLCWSEPRRRFERNELRQHRRPGNPPCSGRRGDGRRQAAAAEQTPTASWPADRPDVTCSPARWSTAWKATSTISTAIQSSATTPTRWLTATRSPSRSRSQPISWRPCVRGSASRRIAISLTSPAARPSPASATPKAT